MKHRATPDFWYHYRQLPPDIQSLSDRCYDLLKLGLAPTQNTIAYSEAKKKPFLQVGKPIVTLI